MPRNVDRHLGRAVHWTLLGGLLVSAILLISGLLLVMLGHTESAPEKGIELNSLFARARHGDGTSFVELGLLILMLTPPLRVAVLEVGWLFARDWWFAGIAFSVLVLLLLGIALGTG